MDVEIDTNYYSAHKILSVILEPLKIPNKEDKSCFSYTAISDYVNGREAPGLEDHLKSCPNCNKKRIRVEIAGLLEDLSEGDINGIVNKLTWDVITGRFGKYEQRDERKPVMEKVREVSQRLDKLVKELYPSCLSASEIRNYLKIKGYEIKRCDSKVEHHLEKCSGCSTRKEFVVNNRSIDEDEAQLERDAAKMVRSEPLEETLN